jgi:transposase
VRRRAQWWHYQGLIDPTRLVFIDETWVKTNMAPLRGWGRRGARLPIKVPYGHWNTMTFIAALRHDRIDAPWLLDAPMNGALFRTYVEKVLAPTLRPNDIVIADNLSSHTGAAVRRAIRALGARLFLLPKYSPDLNPIEQVFAKFKHLLRKAAARTRETVCMAIGELLGSYTPDECANYLRNSGYGRS